MVFVYVQVDHPAVFDTGQDELGILLLIVERGHEIGGRNKPICTRPQFVDIHDGSQKLGKQSKPLGKTADLPTWAAEASGAMRPRRERRAAHGKIAWERRPALGIGTVMMAGLTDRPLTPSIGAAAAQAEDMECLMVA